MGNLVGMDHATLSMKALPFTPIDPAWILESRAFHSNDPEVVRAVPRLLMYAWHADPAGSVPTDLPRFSAAAGLQVSVARDHWDELTEGWTLRDGRLFHDAMAALAVRIGVRFAPVLADLEAQMAATMAAPEEFELTPPQMASRNKGKRALPANYPLTEEMRTWMAAHRGVTDPADQDFIHTKFVTHFTSNGQRMVDWRATWENWVLKENLRNLPSAQNPPSTPIPLGRQGQTLSRADRFGGAARPAGWGTANRVEQSLDHNRSLLGVQGARGG